MTISTIETMQIIQMFEIKLSSNVIQCGPQIDPVSHQIGLMFNQCERKLNQS